MMSGDPCTIFSDGFAMRRALVAAISVYLQCFLVSAEGHRLLIARYGSARVRPNGL